MGDIENWPDWPILFLTELGTIIWEFSDLILRENIECLLMMGIDINDLICHEKCKEQQIYGQLMKATNCDC